MYLSLEIHLNKMLYVDLSKVIKDDDDDNNDNDDVLKRMQNQ